ncbi:phosphatidylglycerophosphatase A [Rhodobacterales bacterium HKCCE2091]|nr:phosphatidylglycerophosphatase A [Rhodobacterales bacterium HKCCE2091]
MIGAQVVATLGGIGHLRPAPGTWGSAAAIPLLWALHIAGGFWLVLAATVAVALLGYWSVVQMTRTAPGSDPSEIVIDEVVGQWIALWPVSLGATMVQVPLTSLWPGLLTAFLAFRLFDIWKPGPVGLFDRMHSPLGVMLDDAMAGFLAAMVVAVAATVAHLVFM